MQSLAVETATTFLGDAAALVNGFGRILTHIVMAPIERIANAADVAGILVARKTARARHREAALLWLNATHRPRRRHVSRRRNRVFGCLGFLSELT